VGSGAARSIKVRALACPATTRARTAAGRTTRGVHGAAEVSGRQKSYACVHGYLVASVARSLFVAENSAESAFVLDFALAVNR
jgi:hypothetical protein